MPKTFLGKRNGFGRGGRSLRAQRLERVEAGGLAGGQGRGEDADGHGQQFGQHHEAPRGVHRQERHKEVNEHRPAQAHGQTGRAALARIMEDAYVRASPLIRRPDDIEKAAAVLANMLDKVEARRAALAELTRAEAEKALGKAQDER